VPRSGHALAAIAATDPDEATQTLLTAHGFSVPHDCGAREARPVTIAGEKVRTGGKWIDADKVRITDAGRNHLRPVKPSAKARHPGRSAPLDWFIARLPLARSTLTPALRVLGQVHGAGGAGGLRLPARVSSNARGMSGFEHG